MPRLFYDLTGLLHWYAYFQRPAGVQRVIEQLGACRTMQNAADLSSLPPQAVEFVFRILGSDRFYRLDPTLLTMMSKSRPTAIKSLRRCFAQGLRLASIGGLLKEARYFHLPYLAAGLLRMEDLLWAADRSMDPVVALQPVDPPTSIDAYFNPGDLWWQGDYVSSMVRLKKRTGVRIVQMIHDLYVMQRPDWSPRGFSQVFTQQFRGIAPHVDRWLTSSAYVKGQVGKLLEDWSVPVQAISVLPMGWDSLTGDHEDSVLRDEAVLERHGIGRRPFILCVGTLEPRKNVPALLDAMESLRHRLGQQVPALVVAGGYGWRAGAARKRLKKGKRDGSLFWVTNLGDEELRAFYKMARFTVMPSHGEGWGLAVQESIALGVPCIASAGGATREAGLDLATYVEPAQPGQLEAAVAAWISSDAALAGVRARIQMALQTRAFSTWNDAGDLLLAEAFAPSGP